MSGIFNAASVAAQPFSKQIHVIDSQYVTLGLGFQVLAAAELALTDPLDNILTVIENVRQRIRVVALLDTLEYVRRSGRVSWARARIGDLLHIKPLVEIRAGRILSLGQVRTRRNGIERLVDMLRNLGNLERLAILHTNAKEEAQRKAAELVKQQGQQNKLADADIAYKALKNGNLEKIYGYGESIFPDILRSSEGVLLLVDDLAEDHLQVLVGGVPFFFDVLDLCSESADAVVLLSDSDELPV